MMPLSKSNIATVPRLEEFYPSGELWMQPSLPMPRQKTSLLTNEASLQAFVTIDDVIQSAQMLMSQLKLLGEYKHPLEVRKGVSVMPTQPDVNRTIKAGGKTYFFDVRKTKEGKPYLIITESRAKGEDGKHERGSVIVFPEHAQEFLEAAQAMVKALQ